MEDDGALLKALSSPRVDPPRKRRMERLADELSHEEMKALDHALLVLGKSCAEVSRILREHEGITVSPSTLSEYRSELRRRSNGGG